MNIAYSTLRLLTLACYFLPCVFYLTTCTNGPSWEDAFNANDAILNETEKLEWKKKYFKTTITNEDFERTKSDSIINSYADFFIYSDNLVNLEINFPDNLIRPTPYSISGIGVILFYKNIVGKIMIGISLFLSFITFVFWFFIRKKKLEIYFISLNTLSVLTFLVICLASQVEMFYGLWVLLFLLFVQLLTEIQIRKNTAII